MKTIPNAWLNAITRTVNNYEGGYGAFTNTKNDRGGLTRAGITTKFFDNYCLPALGYASSLDVTTAMKNLDSAAINALYYEGIVQAGLLYRLENILPLDLLNNIYDFAVLSGPQNAIKTLQRILGEDEDGIPGPKTIASAQERIRLLSADNFNTLYSFERIKFHVRDVQRNPNQLGFLGGWVNRAANNAFSPMD